jgi:signal transduction histidine kinase
VSTLAHVLSRSTGVRRLDPGVPLHVEHAVVELATADDVASGLAHVAAMIRRGLGAARVEWWAPDDYGAPELVAAAGDGCGRRRRFTLGAAGTVVVLGGSAYPDLASLLAPVLPIVRRRRAEERLARTTVQLARRNEALEDFAALVAHELKTPLHAALVEDHPSRSVQQALELVDTLLEAAHSTSAEGTFASAAEPLELAVGDLGAAGIEITAELGTHLPLPGGALRVILRNLLANALAAGGRCIRVSTERSAGSWLLVVDDDGVGLGDVDGYAGGSGLGLALSRRIAARYDGVIELTPRDSGGTRATLALGKAAYDFAITSTGMPTSANRYVHCATV